MEDVNDDLHVIEHDPLACGKAIHRYGAHPIVLEPSLDFARDRFQVRLGSARANDEEIGEGGDSLEIEDDNVLRLFVRREIGAGLG
jgi:hypothetical protein